MTDEADMDKLIALAERADPLGRKLYEDGPTSGLKPNEYAFALALALRCVCRDHGWNPAHLVGTLDEIFVSSEEALKKG